MVFDLKGISSMKLQHILAAALGAAAISGCATVAPRPAVDPAAKAVSEAPKPSASKPAQATAQAPGATAATDTAGQGATQLAPPAQKSARAFFAEGVAAFDAGKYDEARTAFVDALKRSPDDANAQFNLGVVAERQGDLARAAAAYDAARHLDPTLLPAVLNLGDVYRRQGKSEQAVSLYEAALSEPGRAYDVALLNNLLVAYRSAKQYDKAEAAGRKALSRDPGNVLAYKNLALVYYDEGNYQLAEFMLGNARKLDDKDPGVYNILGLIHLKRGEPAVALGQFQKAVSLDEKFAPGHLNIGAMALAHRDYGSAEREFSKVLELDPSSYDARLYYAYALDGQKGRDPKKGVAAGEAFEKVLALRAEQPEAVCGAGWAYAADRSGYDKAVSFLEKCKGLRSGNATELQLIDLKLKGIAAMQKAPPPTPQAELKPAAKPNTGAEDSAVIEKVSAEAAKQEGGDHPNPDTTNTADGAPAPTGDGAGAANQATGGSGAPAAPVTPAAPATTPDGTPVQAPTGGTLVPTPGSSPAQSPTPGAPETRPET